MNKEKLLALATILDSVPRERFRMDRWGKGSACGFAGCAIGWGIHKGVLSDIELRERELNLGYSFLVPTLKEQSSIKDFAAVAQSLDIAEEDATGLFGEEIYGDYVGETGDWEEDNDPKLVAHAIRIFVETGYLPPGLR